MFSLLDKKNKRVVKKNEKYIPAIPIGMVVYV